MRVLGRLDRPPVVLSRSPVTDSSPSSPSPLSSSPDVHRLIDSAAALLDEVLVGQSQAKEALLLGWMTGRHVLLEGPPGCGKTRLAERGLSLLLGASDVRLLSFHRDVRAEELLGDAVLRRQRRGQRERVHIEFQRHGLLDAAGWVLDDLDRAPGEALAPLLHLLSRRRLRRGAADLDASHLHTAVATVTSRDGEAGDGASNPLEPAQLDRFALQIRMRGLVAARRWAQCRQLMIGSEPRSSAGADSSSRSASPAVAPEAMGSNRSAPAEPLDRSRDADPASLGAGERDQDGEPRGAELVAHAVAAVALPDGIVATMHGILEELAERARRSRASGASDGSRTLLSDGGLVSALPALVRAHALRRKRTEAGAEDLGVLRLMVAQRIAPRDQVTLDELLAQALAEERQRGESAALSDAASPQGLPMSADDGESAPGAPVEAAPAHGAPSAEADLPAPEPPPRRPKVRSVDVAPLVRAFEGVLDQGRADLDDDPGGSPRGLRRMRRFDEILDADPLELAMLVDGRLADLPRVFRRRRHTLGGAVIVARDVSSSMAGFRNDWASEVVCGLLRAANRRRMRVGYIEFHQRAMAKRVGGRLLHRRVRELETIVRDAIPLGQTNYEAPLDMALEALRARRGSDRHVVLLTDGLPILGDTLVRRERALARKLGVRLHTVFIGDGECPAVLDDISLETNGLRFQATETRGGGRYGLEIVRRAGSMAPAVASAVG